MNSQSTHLIMTFLVAVLWSFEANAQEESFYKFTSDPAGVSIYIDGSFVGKTDPSVSGSISVGTHRITAKYPGYGNADETLIFKVDALKNFHFKLARSSVKVESLNDSSQATLKAEVGNILITSVPPDLPVRVGGRELGKNTPCKVSGWPAGDVKIEIDGHPIASTVEPGVTTKIRYDLRKNTFKQTFPDIDDNKVPEGHY